MRRIINKCIFIFTLFVICEVCYTKAEDVVKIQLVRHKSIREQVVNAGTALKGIDLKWMKPHPKPQGNDSIALYRYLDSEFYAIVRIGQKAQEFNMVLDTAWGDTWVVSEDCSVYNVACLVHNKYDHTRSSTYKENGQPFVVDAGTYNISGYLSMDTFNVGHINVKNQTFAEITYLPNIYALEKADGVVGLAYRSMAHGYNPIFYNMIQQGLIRQPIFSVFLNRDRNSNHGGVVTLGGIEKRHILENETILYLPVNRTSGFWQFKMDRVEMDDGKQCFGFCLQGCQAIADTSTNSIIAPYNDVLKLNKIIRAKPFAYGRYRVSCDTVPKLPKLKFIIGGKPFKIEGKDYTQKMSVNFLAVCMSGFQANSNKNDNENWYLGGAFFAQYYSIYNLRDNTIGIVKSSTNFH